MDKKNFRVSWFGSIDREFQPQIDTVAAVSRFCWNASASRHGSNDKPIIISTRIRATAFIRDIS